MSPILQVARTEVLEHRRQPWMLFILVLNYALWIAVFGALFLVLDKVVASPETYELFNQRLGAFGITFDAVLRLGVSSLGTLLFTNLPLFVALLSGTSVLHDRDCGTMPYLMLAPMTRLQLLLGKLAGAMAIPLALHLLLVGTSCLLFGRMRLLAPFSAQLGGCPAWWVAFLLGAPASAAFVGGLGTVISALSRDIRTSMQYTSFFFGLLSLAIGVISVDAVTRGVWLQLGCALGFLAATALSLLLGVRLLSRDFAAS